MDTARQILGRKIRKAREDAGLKRDEVAKMVGVGVQAVKEWEYGYKSPARKNLSSLAEALGVSTDYLLDEDILAAAGAPSSSVRESALTYRTAPSAKGRSSDLPENVAEIIAHIDKRFDRLEERLERALHLRQRLKK